MNHQRTFEVWEGGPDEDAELLELRMWLESLNNPYVEIVHVDDEDLEIWKSHLGNENDVRVATRIQQLARVTNIHFFEGDLGENIPDIPKDTPIVVGGSDWDLCVQGRTRRLRSAGFKNVIAERSISFTHLADLAEGRIGPKNHEH